MPIQLIYELAVPPTRLREVHELFARDYLPAARERGMTFAGAYITRRSSSTTRRRHWCCSSHCLMPMRCGR